MTEPVDDVVMDDGANEESCEDDVDMDDDVMVVYTADFSHAVLQHQHPENVQICECRVDIVDVPHGFFDHLLEIELIGVEISSPELASLINAFPECLKSFALVNTNVPVNGLDALADAISVGRLPHLETINIFCEEIHDTSTKLAHSLKVGGTNLTSLQIGSPGDAYIDSRFVQGIFNAIIDGACPNLQSLELTRINMDEGTFRLLGEAIKKLSGLEVLDLMLLGDDHGTGTKAFFEALNSPGSFPSQLKTLCIDQVTVGDDSDTKWAIIAQAIPKYPELEYLDLTGMDDHEDDLESEYIGIVPLLKALTRGACPKLTHLGFDNHMPNEKEVEALEQFAKTRSDVTLVY